MEKLTTELVLYMYHLNKIQEKIYSPCKDIYHHNHDAYVFHSKEEYYQYFLDNNAMINNIKLLDLAVLSNLKNGDIVALKNLCDYIIDRVNQAIEDDIFVFDFNAKQFENISQKQNIKRLK